MKRVGIFKKQNFLWFKYPTEIVNQRPGNFSKLKLILLEPCVSQDIYSFIFYPLNAINKMK